MSEVEEMFEVVDRELTMTGLVYMLDDAISLGRTIDEEE